MAVFRPLPPRPTQGNRLAPLLEDVAVVVTSTFASTLADAVLAASVNINDRATFASTLGDAVLAASVNINDRATFASTLDDAVLAALVSINVPVINFASTLADAVLATSLTVSSVPFTGRGSKSRSRKVRLYDLDAIFCTDFKDCPGELKRVVAESIRMGGLAKQAAMPYKSAKIADLKRLAEDTKKLNRLLKVYRAEVEEREREDMLLLM